MMQVQSDFFTHSIEKNIQNSKLISLIAIEQNVKLFQKGQMIYTQGERAEAFYYLKKGSVAVFLSSEQGSEKILAIQKSGSVIGEASFFDQLPRMSCARALQNSELVVINQPMILQYFRTQPDVALDLLQYLAKTVRMLSMHVDSMTFLHADRRIAQILLQMIQEKNGKKVVSVSQEEIGNIVGVSRITVSRVLNQFLKQGWIATKYREIQIYNHKALQEFTMTPEE